MNMLRIRHRRRRFAGVRLAAVAATAGILLAACGQSGPSSSSSAGSQGTKPVKIGLFVQQLQNSYVTAVLASMNKTADAMNATVSPVDAKGDATTQASQIQDAIISKKYDALIIWPVSSTGVVPYVKQAIAAGIKVGDILFPVGPDYTTAALQVPGMTVAVLKPPGTDGEDQGTAIVSACQGVDPCNLGFLVGSASSAGDQARLQGTKNVIASHSNIKLVAVGEGQYQRGPSVSAVQDMIQAHPDLKVISAVGGQMELGALQAVKGTPLDGKIKFVDDGASTPGMAEMKSGNFYATTLYLPNVEGSLSAKYVVNAVRGSQETAGINTVDDQNRGGLPRVLTQENKALWKDFNGQWSG